jgi:hypothetical protein
MALLKSLNFPCASELYLLSCVKLYTNFLNRKDGTCIAAVKLGTPPAPFAPTVL